MNERKHVYMLHPTDPVVASYKDFFDQLNDPAIHTLNLRILLSDVNEGNCGGVQEMLMAMQHYPHLIEKMLFSIEFHFVDDLTEFEIAEEDWKADPAFYRWFQALMGTPFILFFLADEDSRFYGLIADLVENDEVEFMSDVTGGKPRIGFTFEQGNTILSRLFTSCYNMLLYCHNTDFDPRIYIEGVMALFDAPFTYDEVWNHYQGILNEAKLDLVRN